VEVFDAVTSRVFADTELQSLCGYRGTLFYPAVSGLL
jgi:hypothetical protein